ncbi:MAG: class I SAM-dependent DNA methyltransferase [Bifidobacteriaceae bacterium]|nr:class I SAM-dependent DNA methyltransferase [Bifidobacteriaceae bacterium]
MAKALSMNQIRVRAAEFARKWSDAEGYERGEAQSFVRDLLEVYGITETMAAVYEKRVQRASTDKRGYIDALVPHELLIEMKSANKDLAKAEEQALDYLPSLVGEEIPPWVLTSDFKRFRLTHVPDLIFPGKDGVTVEFSLEDLPEQADRLAFLAGYGERRFGSAEQEAASVKAAKLMGGLFEELDASRYGGHEASVFLVRVLFCLYADDAGVWDKDLFWEFLETRTSEDGSDLGPQLSLLFQAMDRPPERRQVNLDELIAKFPYVDGGLFSEVLPIPAFNEAMRERLLDACAFNWSAISPAVFGSMFQSVKDKKARRQLGEHYTTETNILKVIEPLFLDELRARFDEAGSDVAALRRLRRDMGKMRFLDPACGCGNFLVVAYRELRALDLKILLKLQELQPRRREAGRGIEGQLVLTFNENDLPVRLDHFRGIEIDEFPAVIARTALHLADHQANQAMEWALGKAPETLPLTKTDTIRQGNALRMDWESVWGGASDAGTQLYVFGNPPFVGVSLKTTQQREDLQSVWGRKDIGHLDYVTAWYAKTIELFKRPNHDGEFAFVSTNSITQGEPVPALFGPVFDAGWRIKFAHRTFPWTSEASNAAAVHCVIVGFDKRRKSLAWIYDYPTPRSQPVRRAAERRINAYLIDGPDVFVTERRGGLGPLAPDLPTVGYGSKPADGGNLTLDSSEVALASADRIACAYLRPFVGARELIHGIPRWCLWLTSLKPSDLEQSAVMKSRVEAVRTFRLGSTKARTIADAATPYLFSEIRQPDVPYVCIPRHVSAGRRYFTAARYDADVICGDANFQTPDPDGLAFAAISSSAFITWQRAVGGRIKSDLRFSNTLTWNTFPLPKLDEATRAKLIEAGQGVLDARALHPERSLADHYNPLAMDPALLKAHGRLDAVMDRALGAKHTCADNAERLTLLFRNYAAMTEAEAPELKLRGRRLKAA